VDFIPCICRTPSAEKSVTLVGRSAIDADLSARALEELLGRTHYGAATNRFSANVWSFRMFVVFGVRRIYGACLIVES